MKTRIYAERGVNSCSIDGCDAKYYGSGFCKRHHQWHWKRGLLPKPERVSIRDKILAAVQVNPYTGCWEWQRGRNNMGYGKVSLSGQRREYAHRAAYVEFCGPIPQWQEVCHKCDNPSCCNPEHLFLGSHRDNMRDARRKGRMRPPPPTHGPDHPMAKFTADQVRAIRYDQRPATVIAKDHDCNPETIKRIQDWRTYGTVTCGCGEFA